MQASYVPDALIATPTDMAPQIMEAMIAERIRGHWKDSRKRREFWTFGLSRKGTNTHYEIARILSLDPEEVRRLLFALLVKDLVMLHTATGREITMNASVLSKSFEQIKPHGMEFASNFYKRLFASADDLFAERSRQRDLGLAQGTLDTEQAKILDAEIALYSSFRRLFEGTTMADQCHALLGALAFVIAGVTKNQDIKTKLTELGTRHKAYGVTPEHYPLVGQALIETLHAYFGKDWSQELEATWRDAYDIVSSIMIEAYIQQQKEGHDPDETPRHHA